VEKLFDYNYHGIGCNGKFEIYKEGENRYFAKMISWDQYQGGPPGDIYFRREKQQFRKAQYKTDRFAWSDMIATIGEEVENFEFERRWKESRGK